MKVNLKNQFKIIIIVLLHYKSYKNFLEMSKIIKIKINFYNLKQSRIYSKIKYKIYLKKLNSMNKI